MYKAVVYSLGLLLVARPLFGQQVDELAAKELTKLVEANGGKIGFVLGKECPTCVRGALATKDYKEDEVIAAVPFNMSIKMGLEGDYSSECAEQLLEMRFLDKRHNKTFDLFWKTQPQADEIFTPDLYTPEQVKMLQSEHLETIVTSHQDVTDQVYRGEYGPYKRHVNNIIAPNSISQDQFRWYTSLVVSRAFSFWKDAVDEKARTYFFPLIDMINHSEDPNCARREDDDGFIRQYALRDIKKGEQLWQIYHNDLLHRNDMSLMIYGFINNPDEEYPLLCAVDLPDFNPESPYEHTVADDSAWEPRGEMATADELARLTNIWATFPTTLKEDQDLLESGKYTDWRDIMLLQFRIQRKKALRNVIDALVAELMEL